MRVDYTTYTDGELLQLLQSSDETAFTEIFDRYWDKMLAIAYNLTKDQSAAKEIVQDLFAGVWRRRNDLTISNLQAYLATAVKFSFFKRVERSSRQREIEIQSVSGGPAADISLEKGIESLFLQQYIQGLIEKLPEKCRLVFQYSRIHQLSNAEIAERLQISEKTVEGHLTKGIKLLRIQLRDGGIAIILGTAALQSYF